MDRLDAENEAMVQAFVGAMYFRFRVYRFQAEDL